MNADSVVLAVGSAFMAFMALLPPAPHTMITPERNAIGNAICWGISILLGLFAIIRSMKS